MKTTSLNYRISHFDTIEQAEILIDGITLVTGSHSTGKDKLLNIMYDLTRFPVYFTRYRTDKYREKLEELYEHLDYIWKMAPREYQITRNLLLLREMIYLGDEDMWIEAINRTEDLYLRYCRVVSYTPAGEETATYKEFYLNDYTKEHFMYLIGVDNNGHDIPLIELFEPARTFVKEHFRKRDDFIYHRKTDFLLDYLSKKYIPEMLPESFRIKENDQEILDSKTTVFNEFLTINNVIFIDNPGFFGTRESWYLTSWDYIYQGFLMTRTKKTKDIKEIKNHLSSFIKGTILQNIPSHSPKGYDPFIPKLDYSHFPETWFTYQREDGKSIPLQECSYDIKTFILLERFLENNLLDEKTLLIFNDPEKHLTPEQITGLAEIFVLLHAKYGVKIIISSYNPQMTEAIKKACQMENINGKLNIYEAKPGNDPYHYTFQ